MTILNAIDAALTAHEHAAADATGNPWPGRVPSLTEVIDTLFGPETDQPIPEWRQMNGASTPHLTGIVVVMFTGGPFDGRGLPVIPNPSGTLPTWWQVPVATPEAQYWTDNSGPQTEATTFHLATYRLHTHPVSGVATYRHAPETHPQGQ